MDDTLHRTRTSTCPHVNSNDHRCGSRFSLGRIEQAFGVCFGTYHACPMYIQLNQEKSEARQAAASVHRVSPLVTVTSHGIEAPLRATGT